MSTMSTPRIPAVKNPIQGPGLKAPGVVLLQFLLIFLFEAIEYSFTKVGIFTGVAILIAWAGGLKLGRSGTAFAAVVTPPLAFLISTILIIASLGGTGLSISHIGLDLISMLGAAAPFLVSGAVIGWAYYFFSSRKKN
jgi:hypothetical protein